MRILRPYGVVMNGHLNLGLELVMIGGRIAEIRPHTGVPDAYIISAAFVNAHSHFEYRGMLDAISEPRYFEWIWELTRRKGLETPEHVAQMCDLAVQENLQTGVAWVGEHSDRPGSAAAMAKHRLGGWIFQEMLDAFDADSTGRHQAVHQKAAEARAVFPLVAVSPHAAHTVLEPTLRSIAEAGDPVSIHVCETPLEDEFFVHGAGQIADGRRKLNLPSGGGGATVLEVLDRVGLLRPGTQCVHVCAVDAAQVEFLASRGVTIAHCPRSNVRLRCPAAPVREMLDAGLTVGLGMDSAASGGPLDMFAEMNAALTVSYGRGRPLLPEEVWRMATTMGYQSFGLPLGEAWDVYEGSAVPLIEIHVTGARDVEFLIENANPADVRWVSRD
jgi:5-methylthioadenosine/S-adenosylhomocysteine deaminase